jgi:hypothetical protein
VFEGVPARALPGVEDTRGGCGSCEDSAITLRDSIDRYPDEALAMLTHIAHMIDRTRNRFSESHFDEEADRWLAVFARDLVNSEIRLLLHFMKERAPGGADDLPDQT